MLWQVFSHAFDIVEAAAVFLFTGDSHDDSDFERYIATFTMLDKRATGRESPIGMVIPEGDHLLPNAIWRRRIAEAARNLKSNPLMVVVTPSSVARGIVQAVQWIHPLPFDAATARDLNEAILVAERHRGRPAPFFRDLYQEAKRAALRPSGTIRASSP